MSHARADSSHPSDPSDSSASSDPSGGSGRRKAEARWLARAALALALAAVGLIIFATTLGGAVVAVVVGLAGLALCAVGGWWALTHRGALRAGGVLLAVGALVAVVLVYLGSDRWIAAFGAAAAWLAALACGRSALRVEAGAYRPPSWRTPPPRRPVLIMNPASGGGKVGRFDLVARAEALGCRVVLLDTSVQQDVTAIAQQAVADGADLLGVAGGDGTQALAAAVAAEHGVPFLVISAGTRNHFAMDLGLDRDDPSRCLDALTDGVEIRVDLGEVAGRTFVNNASFGVYAEIVQSPEYRDAKAATSLKELPDLLTGYAGAHLSALAGDVRIEAPQAVLVSAGPYASGWYGSGRRPRLDTGQLGVIALTVTTAAQAADLVMRGEQSTALTKVTAHEVVITADRESIPAGVDGEALTLTPPVRCRVVPGALRVRVPRHRPGVPAERPPVHWRQLGLLALGRETGSGS